jgi:DNA-binding transcriptional MerR regulator
MKDYYSVQEFSKLSGVEASTLRYWDDIGLFSPIRRDPENNYRYYSLAQITALNFVTTLSDLDIPLKMIAELREERTPEKFLRLLEKQERQLDMELRALRERSSIIHARRELINYGMNVIHGFVALDGVRMDSDFAAEDGTKIDESEICVLYRDKKELILWPRNEYNEGDTFVAPLAAFISQTHEHNINLSFPVGGYHESLEAFVENPNHPDHFFSIDPIGTHIRKAGDYLIGFNRGPYGEMGDMPERMSSYAKENNITVSGPVYTMYLHDEICTKDPNQYLAQSCVAVKKRNRE